MPTFDTQNQILTKIIATCEKRSNVWQIYDRPFSSNKIFCKMNVATVLLSSDPDSMIRKHNGIISVLSKKVITSSSSVWKWSGIRNEFLL